MKRFCLLVLILIMAIACQKSYYDQDRYDEIVSGFITPTDDNVLWCYWYWVGDDISQEQCH